MGGIIGAAFASIAAAIKTAVGGGGQRKNGVQRRAPNGDVFSSSSIGSARIGSGGYTPIVAMNGVVARTITRHMDKTNYHRRQSQRPNGAASARIWIKDD